MTLNLTETETKIIVNALLERPAKEVYQILNNVLTQIQQQQTNEKKGE